MASFEFTKQNLSRLKKELRRIFPDIGSSHLSEALASALKQNTHASLKNKIGS